MHRTDWLEIVLSGFGVATLIVPAGARLVGEFIAFVGFVLQEHGRRLGRAYTSYLADEDNVPDNGNSPSTEVPELERK